MLFADVLLDFHDVSADGTLVTTAILANCERSTETAGFDATPTPSTSITLGAHVTNMLDAVTIGTSGGLTVYPPTHTSRSIHQNNTISNEQIKLWLDPSLPSGTHTKFSYGGFITFGPTNAGGAASLYDYCVMAEGVGRTSTLQLSNGLATGTASGYGVNIESVIGSTVSHSNYIQVTPGGTYWCTHMTDFVANVTRVNIYDLTGALVGTISTILDSGAGTAIAYLLIGNNEAGNQGGTSVFENFIVAYTNPVFPLGPSALAVTAPVYTSSPALVRKRLAKQHLLAAD